MYSSGGVGSYQNLESVGGAHLPLAFGRFDGDAKTDVFGALLDGSTFDFIYSAGGVADFTFLSTDNSVEPSLLRYGDFDGDLRTDVLQVSDNGDGTSLWVYFPGGKQPTVTLGTRPVALQDIQFGDFDGDGKTDPFTTRALPDGRLEWIYWAAGIGDPIVLNTVDGPVPQLGQFVGDGRTDAMVIRCGAEPVIAPLPELDVAKVPQSVFQHFIGDVTGDGIPDVVRYSSCQNHPRDHSCGASANLVQTAIADGHGGFSDTTNLQVLFSGINLDDAVRQLIDANGDGLADLVWLNSVASRLDVYVATAVGDGSFAETPKQTLSVPPGFVAPGPQGPQRRRARGPHLDDRLSGADGLPTSPAAVPGDDNKVLVALAGPGGTFAVSSPQSLGAATGWDGASARSRAT